MNSRRADIFNDHNQVIPAVGLIKKIDFFIKDKPFDLKVTYLPEGYIKEQRKSKGLRPELTLLKQAARSLNITYDRTASETFLITDLWRKLDDHPHLSAIDLISELKDYRINLLNECIQTPVSLVRWLYENQGVRRFDAANRLFLVLVDQHDFFESWKLKRAKSLISNRVYQYLDTVGSSPGFELDFDWQGNTHTVEADVVFVTK